MDTDPAIVANDLQSRFAILLDAKRWDELRAIFTDDAAFDPSAVGLPRVAPADAIIAWFRTHTEAMVHHVTNTVVDSYVGDTMETTSKLMLLREDGSLTCGTYLDVLRRDPVLGWRIAEKVLVPAPPADAARTREARAPGRQR
jgi:hypothetical protein